MAGKNPSQCSPKLTTKEKQFHPSVLTPGKHPYYTLQRIPIRYSIILADEWVCWENLDISMGHHNGKVETKGQGGLSRQGRVCFHPSLAVGQPQDPFPPSESASCLQRAESRIKPDSNLWMKAVKYSLLQNQNQSPWSWPTGHSSNLIPAPSSQFTQKEREKT